MKKDSIRCAIWDTHIEKKYFSNWTINCKTPEGTLYKHADIPEGLCTRCLPPEPPEVLPEENLPIGAKYLLNVSADVQKNPDSLKELMPGADIGALFACLMDTGKKGGDILKIFKWLTTLADHERAFQTETAPGVYNDWVKKRRRQVASFGKQERVTKTAIRRNANLSKKDKEKSFQAINDFRMKGELICYLTETRRKAQKIRLDKIHKRTISRVYNELKGKQGFERPQKIFTAITKLLHSTCPGTYPDVSKKTLEKIRGRYKSAPLI